MLWKKSFVLLLVVTLAISAVLLPGCTLNEKESTDGGNTTPSQLIEDISVSGAFNLIQQNQDNSEFAVLDVRRANEYNASHIAGAIMIDFYSASFKAELDALDKDKTYLVYCASGNRSGQAQVIMEDLGFSAVYNMLSGFNGWVSAGYATV